jgi:hypothetical protein
MKKINNYCFKCESTELLLLGGSDIFCSNCHLVFQDSETFEYIEFKNPNPIDSKYFSIGSWNFSSMLRVFYGWLVRINKLFNINEFYIQSEYIEYNDDLDNETIIKTKLNCISSLDSLINSLFNQTLKESNKEKYDFIDTSRNTKKNNDNYRSIKITIYCVLKANNVRYDLADFTVMEDNYSNHNLHFEDWNLLTISNEYFNGSFSSLKRAYDNY